MVERLSSDRKLNPDEAEENTDQYMDGEDWLSQGFQTHVFDGEAPPPAPSIWVRKEIFKPEVLHYNNMIEAIESGEHYDSIYLDYSKAFGKVDNLVLKQKIQKTKIKGPLAEWL